MTILRFITLWMTFSIVPVELKGFQDTNKSVEGKKNQQKCFVRLYGDT